MIFFTFLGIGKVNDKGEIIGYSNVEYNLKSQKYITPYVQVAILKHHKDEIKTLVVFITKKAYDFHKEYLEDYLQEEQINVDINYEFIDLNVKYEDLLKVMFKYLKNGSKYIIDVTHSFRIIPFKLFTTLDYINTVTKAKLEHIYYGNFENKKIEDFVKDVANSKIATALEFFNKTLKVDMDLFNGISFIDNQLYKFLENCAKLNQVIELADFDHSVGIVNSIVADCKRLKKNPDYIFFVEFLDAILIKFEGFDISNKINAKTILITALLKSDYYQLAITFTDQLFREELIINTLGNQLYQWIVRDDKIYDISQLLLSDGYYNLKKNVSKKQSELIDEVNLVFYDNARTTEIKSVLFEYKLTFDTFFNDVRNKLNHGSMPDKSININKVVNDMCCLIQKLNY